MFYQIYNKTTDKLDERKFKDVNEALRVALTWERDDKTANLILRTTEKSDLQEKIEELEEAKKAVQSCLEDFSCLVGMHGLEYWARVVERLRSEIKELL